MLSPRKPAEQSRTWAVTLIRKKGDFLGTVDAPDLAAAEQPAAEKFGLTPG